MRVGIIGAGEISRYHLEVLTEIDSVEIVAICDLDASRANRMKRLFNIENGFSNYIEMIDQAKPEAVHVLTPPKFHAEISMQAMKKGCHALVEKPMALSHDDAAQMVEISKKNNRRLAVCEIYHFDPAVLRARRMIEAGYVGEIVHVEGYWFPDIANDSHAYSTGGTGDGWAYDLPGGVFANFLDHPVYLQRALLGRIDSIQVICRKIGENPFVPFDEMRVHLGSDNKTGYIVASLNSKPRISANGQQ
jgi:predicted dehydrogenase